jgi:cytochrome c-type biogenesis protein CcmH/NrfG
MIRENPRDAGAWNGLGSIEALRGNFRTAIEYIDTALKIEPDYDAAIEDRAMVLRMMETGSGD